MRKLDTEIQAGRRIPRGGREPNRLLMVVGIVTSVLLHGGIVALIVWSALLRGEPEPEDPEMLEFEDVELLALGEEKPPNQLPRMANPAPPEVKEDAVNLAQPKDEPEPKKQPEKKEEKPQKPPEKKPDKSELLKKLSALHNPNRPTNTDVPEGSEQGVAGGTVTDAAMANMMNTYQAKLLQALGKYWQVPTTLEDAEIKKLAGTVVVYVRLSESGKVVDYRFRAKSDNDQFNASIDRLMRRFSVSGGHQLPMPSEPKLRELVRQKGLNLRNWKAITGR